VKRQRTSRIKDLLIGRLGLAAASNPFIYDRDLAPFVRLAFPHAPTDRTELTTGQRTFLGALAANGYQPFGEALCLLPLGT
jgi:hypothetical protein